MLRGASVQPEIGAEIDAPDLFIGRQTVGRAAPEDDPVGDDVRAVGDPQRLAHVVIGDEHADARDRSGGR